MIVLIILTCQQNIHCEMNYVLIISGEMIQKCETQH